MKTINLLLLQTTVLHKSAVSNHTLLFFCFTSSPLAHHSDEKKIIVRPGLGKAARCIGGNAVARLLLHCRTVVYHDLNENKKITRQ